MQVDFFQTLKIKCIKPFHFSFVDLDITSVIMHLFTQRMLIKPGLELSRAEMTSKKWSLISTGLWPVGLYSWTILCVRKLNIHKEPTIRSI